MVSDVEASRCRIARARRIGTDPGHSPLGADRGEIGDTRIDNPLRYVSNYLLQRWIVRRVSVIATFYDTFGTFHDRFRGRSGPRAGWSRRQSPDCQCLPIEAARCSP